MKVVKEPLKISMISLIIGNDKMKYASIEYVRFGFDGVENVLGDVESFFRNSSVSAELRRKIANVGYCWYVHYGNIFNYDIGISFCLSDILPYHQLTIADDIWALEITLNKITMFDRNYTIVDRYNGYYKHYLDSASVCK